MKPASACAAAGRRFIAIAADLESAHACQEIVQRGHQGKLGAVDILVNNAGIIRRSEALDFSEADWDAVLNVNLKTVFFLSQAAARHMVRARAGGKIINIASMLSFQGGIRVRFLYRQQERRARASRACWRTSGPPREST